MDHRCLWILCFFRIWHSCWKNKGICFYTFFRINSILFKSGWWVTIFSLFQVVRNVTLVQVKINGTEYFRKTISATGQLDAQVLLLGGMPHLRSSPTPVRQTRNVDRSVRQASDTVSPFKGIIQDVQVWSLILSCFKFIFMCKERQSENKNFQSIFAQLFVAKPLCSDLYKKKLLKWKLRKSSIRY